MLILGFTLCLASVAEPASLWLMEPVAMAESVPQQVLDRVGKKLYEELSQRSGYHVFYGRGALMERARSDVQAPVAVLDRARRRLERSEELYLNFSFAEAASSAAETAAQLEAVADQLNGDQMSLLYHARVLEAVAWAGDGKTEAATDAFEKLVVIHANYEPPVELMPPEGVRALQHARGRVFARGLGSLQVVSTPPGASVVIDGRPLGETPVTLHRIPQGVHRIGIRLAGHLSWMDSVQVGVGHQTTTAQLEPEPVLLAHEQLVEAIRRGGSPQQVAAPIATVKRQATCEAVVLVGVSKRDEGTVVSALYVGERRGFALVQDLETAPTNWARLSADALAGKSFASQIPVDAEPMPVDFERWVLGIAADPDAYGAGSGAVLASPWFWAGAVAFVGSATAAALWLRGGPDEAEGPVGVTVDFEFPQ